MEEQKKVNPLATEKEGKLIAKFAIPAIISMLVSSLYNIVDQIFIGQGVGLLGNAATNIAFPVSIICTATALLLGIGSASNFNLCSGAGDHEKASRVAGNRTFHAGDLRSDHCGSGTGILKSASASVRSDGEDLALCTGLYRNHGIRNSISDIDDWRQPSNPCRQKPDVFYDLYADRSDYQYDSGSIIYLRIPLGNQRCCMGDGDRTDRIRDYGNRIFRTIP